MNDSVFDSWYNGMVGFHINSERIFDDLFFDKIVVPEDAIKLRKWMVVCWNNAIEAAHEYNGVDVGALKEKI